MRWHGRSQKEGYAFGVLRQADQTNLHFWYLLLRWVRTASFLLDKAHLSFWASVFFSPWGAEACAGGVRLYDPGAVPRRTPHGWRWRPWGRSGRGRRALSFGEGCRRLGMGWAGGGGGCG